MDHVSQNEASAEHQDGDGSRSYCRNHRNILGSATHMKSKQCVDIMVINESARSKIVHARCIDKQEVPSPACSPRVVGVSSASSAMQPIDVHGLQTFGCERSGPPYCTVPRMDRGQQFLIQILERDCRDVAEQKAALKNRARPALGMQVARQFHLLQAMVLKHLD